MKVRKAGTMLELVQELQEEVLFLAAHLFRANWQQTQFTAMRTSAPFPRNTVGMVLDFAENFTCKFQDEVQAAHWYHDQVTVHPMVTYYACPVCGETVTESLVCISDDRKHDYDCLVYLVRVSRLVYLVRVTGWVDCFQGLCTPWKLLRKLSLIVCTHLCIRHCRNPMFRVSIFVVLSAHIFLKVVPRPEAA